MLSLLSIVLIFNLLPWAILLFLIKLIFVVGIPMRLGCFADSFFDIGQINQHF